MKKQIISLTVFIFIQLNCFSQINFENGYFINEDDQKVECLIKNADWKHNPDGFDYKLSENDESQRADINKVKEFSITGVSKYVRAFVNIDRSSNELYKMSQKKNPVFQEELLFLKVLIEGKADLLQYVDRDIERFFFKTAGHEIEQLVYKRYKVNYDQVGENNHFHQQLLNDMGYMDITLNNIQTIEYNSKELERFFIKYNEGEGADYLNFNGKKERDKFNLTLRPGVNISNLLLVNTVRRSSPRAFDTETGFRFGIECEFILPFNKNKWGLMVEPTYQYYKSEKESTIVNYKSIEFPIGLRYYIFLGEKSKIFLNASYVIDINSKNSTIDYPLYDLEISSFSNFAFGIGYKYHRFSGEFRYFTNRDLLNGYNTWLSEYNNISVVFGITIF